MTINTIQEQLSRSFELYNSKIAIECDNIKISYAKLDEISNHIAHTLLSKGVRKGSIIGILMTNKIDIISTILGILKAGCAFVPLDPANPLNRLKLQVSSADISFCFVSQVYEELWSELSVGEYVTGIVFEDLLHNTIITSDNYLKEDNNIDDMIYLYFTSGTSGTPKAVAGRNQSLLHFINWEIECFNIEEGCRVSQFTSQCHDPFLRDIFVPLFVGGTICIPMNKEVIISPTNLIKWINDSGVNIIHCTPGVFNMFNSDNLMEDDFKNLKYIFLAGEKIIPYSLTQWYNIFNERIQLINLYGPTETTLAKLYYLIKPDDVKKDTIPIGMPIKGCKAIILDKNMNISNEGEIFIRTPYRTLGYFNDHELTLQKFIQNPFNSDPKDIIYKTGDIGRILPDGNIEFIGRHDRQVKIRGFRVELAEIENCLLKHKDIDQCIVNFRYEQAKEKYTNNLQRCVKCDIPETYEDIKLDKYGVCNVCNTYEKNKNSIQSYFKSEKELVSIFDKKSDDRKGDYDCMLLYSGGKDSTYVLYKLVDMGLNVLAYTFDNGFISNDAFENMQKVVKQLNVDHVIDTYSNMNLIFRKGLEEEKSVCNGCFKVLRTLSTRLAYEKGIKYILTGFSRGQILDLRLDSILKAGIFDMDEIENKILEQRILYHCKNDYVTKTLGKDIVVDRDVLSQVQIIDFFRYYDVTKKDILHFLKQRSPYWENPSDTGFCSSNCKINDIGMYIQRTELGYDNYTYPNSWEVRLGHLAIDDAKKENAGKIDIEKVRNILKEIDYEYKLDSDKYSTGYLVAYIVSKAEISDSELHTYLSQNLPDYMLPTWFSKIDKIPLTPNGKVDYNSLPDPKNISVKEFVGPRNEIEEKLHKIWSEILNIDKISVNQDFMKIGGHSLNIMSMISDIYNEFEVEIPLGVVFENLTIEKLSLYIENEILNLSNSIDTKSLNENGELKINTTSYNQNQKNEVVFDNNYIGYENNLSNIVVNNELNGIYPFNDIFYISCFYNALFPIVKYFNSSIIPFLINNIASYEFNKDKQGVKFDVDFISIQQFDKILNDANIEVENRDPQDKVIQQIIEAINNGRPVILGVDSYYQTMRKDTYQKNHWPHSLLIYGYDISDSTFAIIEHNSINSLTYKNCRIYFEEIYNSYFGYLKNFKGSSYPPAYLEFYMINDDKRKIQPLGLEQYTIYKSDYEHNLVMKQDDIFKGIENILKIQSNFKDILENKSLLDEHISNLIFVLDNIINSKISEEYKVSLIYGENSEIVDMMHESTRNWKVIRAMIQKYKYTGEYNTSSISNSINRMTKSYELEKLIYEKIFSSLGTI